jgi:hypothetical protein
VEKGMQRGKVVPVTKEESNSQRTGQECEGARFKVISGEQDRKEINRNDRGLGKENQTEKDLR